MTHVRFVFRVSAVASSIVLGVAAQTVGVSTAFQPQAQSAPPQVPAAEAGSATFEVASIKPNKAGNGQTRVDMAGGRFTTTNVTLRDLVKLAYPVQTSLRGDDQIVGGPSWINVDRFDVLATAPALGTLDTTRAAGAVQPQESTALNEVRVMVRNLLADRFKLGVHHENRELQSYALIVAKSDGTLGQQFRKADVDCATLLNSGKPPVPLEPGKAACGGFRFLGPGRLTGHAVTLPMFVSLLSNLPAIGRIVRDSTGLNGSFDLDLEWTPNPPSQLEPLAGASIFTALQEQLGLKLESQRGPVDVLVIDHAEQPTPD